MGDSSAPARERKQRRPPDRAERGNERLETAEPGSELIDSDEQEMAGIARAVHTVTWSLPTIDHAMEGATEERKAVPQSRLIALSSPAPKPRAGLVSLKEQRAQRNAV